MKLESLLKAREKALTKALEAKNVLAWIDFQILKEQLKQSKLEDTDEPSKMLMRKSA